MDSAQELICCQHNFSACLAEIGGEVFHDLRYLVGTQLNVLVAAGGRRE